MDQQRADQLSKILGGDVWQSGGGIFLIIIKRQDGKLVVFSDEMVCEYENEAAFDDCITSKVVPLI